MIRIWHAGCSTGEEVRDAREHPELHGGGRPHALRANVVFAPHNLVTDGSFNVFNLILCRNVIIYFNRSLQDRVHHLLHASLSRFGYLVLGARETVRFTAVEGRYQELPHHVFRKVA